MSPECLSPVLCVVVPLPFLMCVGKGTLPLSGRVSYPGCFRRYVLPGFDLLWPSVPLAVILSSDLDFHRLSGLTSVYSLRFV